MRTQGDGGSGSSARSAPDRANGAAGALDDGSDSETEAPEPRLVRVRLSFNCRPFLTPQHACYQLPMLRSRWVGTATAECVTLLLVPEKT